MRLPATLLVITGTAGLAACQPAPAETTPASGPAATPAAAGDAGNAPAAGTVVTPLTDKQILDADLVDANGRDLGDVEEIVRGAGNAITALRVEINDTEPDRYVDLPYGDLTAVADGDDWDFRTTMTREQLLALPAAPKPR